MGKNVYYKLLEFLGAANQAVWNCKLVVCIFTMLHGKLNLMLIKKNTQHHMQGPQTLHHHIAS